MSLATELREEVSQTTLRIQLLESQLERETTRGKLFAAAICEISAVVKHELTEGDGKARIARVVGQALQKSLALDQPAPPEFIEEDKAPKWAIQRFSGWLSQCDVTSDRAWDAFCLRCWENGEDWMVVKP